MRELRVEDALMYLDQVKMEFGDRPHIYNEFLDIMKTFKSQQIDTPGVIRRVSTLFQGNKKLVLGFNTFLPEGYKIELPLDGAGQPFAVYRSPGQAGVTQILPSGPPPGPPPAAAGPAGGAGQQQQPQAGPPQGMMGQGVAGAPAGPGPQPPQQQQQEGGMPPHLRGQQPGPGPGPAAPGGPPHGPPQGQAGPPQQQQQQQQPQRMEGQPGGPPPGYGQPPGGRGGGPPPGGPGGMPPSYQQGRAGPPPGRGPPGGPGQQPPQQQQQQQQGGPPGPHGVQGPPGGPRGGPPPHLQGGPQPQPMGSMGPPPPGQQPQGQQPQRGGPPPMGGPPPPGQGGAPPPAPQQPVEFDHAINYVTTIKKRFAQEPETYKKFLEILHTYQKEQRGIKDVLDEVSALFADHPDLLKDFTYFLPDAVQAQAKAQLEQVAKQAEARKRAQTSRKEITAMASERRPGAAAVGSAARPPAGPGTGRGQAGAGIPPSAAAAAAAGYGGAQVPVASPVPFGATQGRSEEKEREICRTAIYGIVSFDPVRPPRRNEPTPAQAATKFGRPRMIPELPVQYTTNEAAFFQRARLHLSRKELAPDKPPGSRRHTPHTEFLKCLHLFGAGILNREELLLLLRGLFMQGHAPKSGANAGGGASSQQVAAAANQLLTELEAILIGRGPYAEQERLSKDSSKYGSVTSRDYDYSKSERVTPSYKTYPPDFPKKRFYSHSGQSEEDAAVLNDVIVCVPAERSTGGGGGAAKKRLWESPEDYDGVKERKNMYEDAMIKIEEDRFEVDMAIERNASAKRQVEPLAEEATMLRENEEKDGQPIGRLRYKLRSRSLSSNHIGAIARLYGDSGDEVLHHLMRNPISVLPIVFRRLNEKDSEWRKARTELAKQWRSVLDENHEGARDVLCYFYRKEIERIFGADRLLEECKRARYFAKHPERQEQHPAVRPLSPVFAVTNPDPKAVLYQPHLQLPMSNKMPHKDAYQCITLVAMNGVAKNNADRERVSRVWAEFIVPWFNLPVYLVAEELRRRARADKSSSVVKFAPGQRVRTAYGDGTILSLIEGNPVSAFRYKVKLSFGTAYVRPSAMVHVLPSESKAQYARRGSFMEFVERPEERPDREGAALLDPEYQVIFGTEKIYLFMRLYCLLVRLLSNTRDHFDPNVKDEGNVKDGPSQAVASIRKDTEESYEDEYPVIKPKYAGYRGLIAVLKDHLGGGLDYKAYETWCRTLSKKKVPELASIPRLLDKCADALVKVAREDVLLPLHDLSLLKHMDDPVLLRSQSLNTTNDATYRIQYRPSDGHVSCSYLPPEIDLLTAPTGLGGALQDDEEGEDGMDVDAGGGRDPPPQAKRIKLK